MNELIKITEDNGQKVVSARDLHKFLEATERFSVWFDRQAKYSLIENVDYVGCKVFNTLANQEVTDYALTLDSAKAISMVQRNDKGYIARQYFIQCEKTLKQQLPLALPNFEDPAEAARAWAIQYEGRLALEAKTEGLEKDLEVKETAIETLTANFAPGMELDTVIAQFNGVNLNLYLGVLVELGFVAKIDKEYKNWAGISRLHGYKKTGKSTAWFQPSISTHPEADGRAYNTQKLLVTEYGIKKLYGLYMAGKLPMRKDWNEVYHYVSPDGRVIKELSEKIRRQVMAVHRKEIARVLIKPCAYNAFKSPSRSSIFGIKGVIFSAGVYSDKVIVSLSVHDSYARIGEISSERPILKAGGVELEYDKNTFEVVAYCWVP